MYDSTRTDTNSTYHKQVHRSHDNTNADEEEEEDAMASRNMRRKRNKTKRKLLTSQHQDNQVHWQRTVISTLQQITNDRRLSAYQSQITPSEENNSYEYKAHNI